ncbi:MAG TPA: YlxR family protein [Methylomirabilota bacterium]|nr:YlxR family protein [Methylomirabilota bacterium]
MLAAAAGTIRACPDPRMRSPREGPRRTCVGCRQVRPKLELVRLVRRPDGVVVHDPTGVGRGAYLCADPGCLERAMKSGRFAQAFRKPCEAGASLEMVVRAAGRPGAAVRAAGQPGAPAPEASGKRIVDRRR